MKLSRYLLAVLPAAGLVAMWPFAASTTDVAVGTHIIDGAYAAQQPRMVATPQILPTPTGAVVGVHPDGSADYYRGTPPKVPAHTRIVLPSCKFEDGSGGPLPCRWDAGYVGPDSNGIGLSFDVYPVGKRAHGVQKVKYVYDDGHTEYGTI